MSVNGWSTGIRRLTANSCWLSANCLANFQPPSVNSLPLFDTGSPMVPNGHSFVFHVLKVSTPTNLPNSPTAYPALCFGSTPEVLHPQPPQHYCLGCLSVDVSTCTRQSRDFDNLALRVVIGGKDMLPEILQRTTHLRLRCCGFGAWYRQKRPPPV